MQAYKGTGTTSEKRNFFRRLACLAAGVSILLLAVPAAAQNADLKIQLFSSTTEPPAGEQFTYTIIVDNLGPDTADDVVIHDTLVTSNFVDPNGCSIAVRTEGGAIDEFNCNFALSAGVFDLGTMGSNHLNPRGSECTDPNAAGCGDNGRDPGRIIVTINLTAEEAVTVSSTADVVSLTNDPDTSNNEATTIHTWEAVADLGVTKSTTTPIVNAGESAQWSVRVENHGPSAAENALLLETMPSGVVEGSVDITGNIVEDISGIPVVHDPVSCSVGTVGDASDPARCDLGGLPAGWGAELTVQAQIDPAFIVGKGLAPPIGLHTDVEVTSDTLDANFEDNDNCEDATQPCPPAPDQPNFDGITIDVDESADLALSKFAIGTPTAGEEFHYEFDISNLGPSVARDLTLRDFLPDGIKFIDAVVDLEDEGGFQSLPCSITEGSNALFCPLGNIPLTGSVPILAFATVTIDTSVPNGASLTNNADVFLSDTEDPATGNNSDVATIIVDNPLDIDYFTEGFDAGAVDLEGQQIELIPNDSDDRYLACIRPINSPGAISGTPLDLGDDDSVEVVLNDGKKVLLYGRKFDRLHIGSNGYVTLGESDTEYLVSPTGHFSIKRIAPFFADLDPRDAGEIWWAQTGDSVVVAWENVPGYNQSEGNTFYLELFYTGEIIMKLSSLDGLKSVTGISQGMGVPDPFTESDFVGSGDYPACSTVTSLLYRDDFQEF